MSASTWAAWPARSCPAGSIDASWQEQIVLALRAVKDESSSAKHIESDKHLSACHVGVVCRDSYRIGRIVAAIPQMQHQVVDAALP